MIQKKPPQIGTTSIYLTVTDKSMLKNLCEYNSCNRGSMIRRLIIEAHTLLKYEEKKKCT